MSYFENIPVGEMTNIHKCKDPPKMMYPIYRQGKTPFTKDWVLYAHGYLITAKHCIYCGEKLDKSEESKKE